jgi:hypothetical protein
MAHSNVKTCSNCAYRGDEMFAEDDEVLKVHCDFPANRMPLSFQGYAQRERELVRDDAENCPTHRMVYEPCHHVAAYRWHIAETISAMGEFGKEIDRCGSDGSEFIGG